MQNETSFSHHYREITRIPFTVGHHLREKQEKERLRTFLKEISYPKSAVKLTETKLTFKNLFIYLLFAALGLCCYKQTFSSCGSLVSLAGATLHYSAWASHCSGFSCYGAPAQLLCLSHSAACGIFPNQGMNPSLILIRILHHQGSPRLR